MNKIDNTAIIYPRVVLGDESCIEPFALLGLQDRFHSESDLVIGHSAFIGSRCTIYAGVTIGDHFDISDQSTVFYDNVIGNYCRIGPKAVIKNGCRIADHVRVNAQVFMESVILGSHIFIGPGTVFTNDKHPPCPNHSDCMPKTVVDSYVSFGANVTIAPGIKIGHHTQVYAGAVIIDPVEPYSVMAGNPAKKIKDFRELTCSSHHYIRAYEWWPA